MSKLLDFAWQQRAKLRAEGNKLWAESGKLRAESNKLYAEGNKLYAEGNKLYAEGDKLYAEGDILWYAAITAKYGQKITVEWTNDGCKLGNGKEFKNA